MADVQFLEVEDILNIHRESIQRVGGLDGIRDTGLLQAAVAMPQQAFGGELLHADLASQAAAYLFHICQAHAFLDGDKRSAAPGKPGAMWVS